MLSDSVVVLDWAVTHQSDPFPCPYSTGPSGSALLGKHLPRIRRRRRHELQLILKMLILLMEKLPLSELFLCQAGFAAKACTWAVQSFKGGGSCVLSSRLGSVPGPPEPLAELPPPVRLVFCNPPGMTAPLWHALINVHGPARVHPRQNRSRSGVEDIKFAVAPWTCDFFFHLGVSTLDSLCGSLADRGNFFFPFVLAFVFFCERSMQLSGHSS